ncbi:MAG: hypothetical protein ACNA8W_00670 [Bradymonadaceae bacterium]
MTLTLTVSGCDFFFNLDDVPLVVESRDVTDAEDTIDVGPTDVDAHSPADAADVDATDEPDVPVEEPDTRDVSDADTRGPDAELDAEPDAELDATHDAELDATHDAELDATPDAEPDAEPDAVPDAEPDAEPDADAGPPPVLCPTNFGDYSDDWACSVVDQDCSTVGCNLHFETNPPTGPPIPECRGTPGPLEEGVTCEVSGERCQKGLMCTGWPAPDPRGQNCSAFCFMSTGRGCGPDSFCTLVPSVAHLGDIGLCTPRCDPSDADACGAGQACVADHAYPAATCFPEFRCLTSGTPASADYKSTCDRSELHKDGKGCSDGLTCYPTGEGQRCVKPCKNNGDCGSLGLSCSQPQGDFELRFCE